MSTEGKQKIIEAAKNVICKNGITGATIRTIAEEAGMSTGAIYHYYKSKEDILYDVMDKSLSEASRIAEKSHSKKQSRDELIEEIYENIAKRFNKNDENRVQFYLAQEAMLGNIELTEKFKFKYKEWIDHTVELIENMYGKHDNKYNRAFASLLIGAIDGIVMQLLLNSNITDDEELAEVYHHILKVGIPSFMDYLDKLDHIGIM
ncbi:TetR/AcrR family transcriptional regulator [Clostridium omnivorum]|uniref:TetR family transcriptional regulator n=1 Tax=Clostridium omnivorum TaxID=1604902 RepID=A0ABQ5N2Y7_9CLOT|nr:TetR/AcrR family transcriptional regulator [Clostridium sp. E14]GLC29514.1 TetR family transcriptional regulator [Clostridium sp. E14]